MIDDEGQPRLSDPMFELWLQRLGLTPAAGDKGAAYAPDTEQSRARPRPPAEAPGEGRRAGGERPPSLESRDLKPRAEPHLRLGERVVARAFSRCKASCGTAPQPGVRAFLVLAGVVDVPLAVAFGAAPIRRGRSQSSARVSHVGTPPPSIPARQLLLVVVVAGLTSHLSWSAMPGSRSSVPPRPPPCAQSPPSSRTARCSPRSWAGARRGDWQSFLLWFHQQDFGLEYPLHHSDIGFFVFSLPFLEKLSSLLILILVTGSLVAIFVHVHTGALAWRPLRATHSARVHLAFLGGLALLLLAWRLHLETFAAESRQTPTHAAQPFPGPHFVDVRVRITTRPSASSPTWRSPARSR